MRHYTALPRVVGTRSGPECLYLQGRAENTRGDSRKGAGELPQRPEGWPAEEVAMAVYLRVGPIVSERWFRYGPSFFGAVARRDKAPKGSVAWKAAQAEVRRFFGKIHARGSFRDSYASGLLENFGLDWWDVIRPMLNRREHL